MSERPASTQNVTPESAAPTRQPWVRPTVTKMDAGDAELGTRPSVADGAFSVS